MSWLDRHEKPLLTWGYDNMVKQTYVSTALYLMEGLAGTHLFFAACLLHGLCGQISWDGICEQNAKKKASGWKGKSGTFN